MVKSITVLGSTGSIGTQTLEVAKQLGIKVFGLSANTSSDLIIEQYREFRPKKISLSQYESYIKVRDELNNEPVEVLYGEEGIKELVLLDSDLLVNALVGFAGLDATYRCVLLKKDIALANKESLVVYGYEIMRLAKENNLKLLPIDSEHSAIFQCLNGEDERAVDKLILTASGGPFRDMASEKLKTVTPKMALKHPNWSMGKKITIDSATMMNKGLEIIEAHHLFNMDKNKIDVVVHKESIIHSMVAFKDGAIMAQLGFPDMKVPISYAITYPKRDYKTENRKDLFSNLILNFEKPRLDDFICLRHAMDILEMEKSYGCVLNAANEVCVDAFLEKRIAFTDIGRLIGKTIEGHLGISEPSYEQIIELDRLTRIKTNEMIDGGI